MRESVKLAREILAQPAFEEFCDYEIKPGIDVQSDEAIDEFVRENSETEYHPSCSCRMGDSNQNDTVVGFDGKVVGKISFYRLLSTSSVFSFFSYEIPVKILNKKVKKYFRCFIKS